MSSSSEVEVIKIDGEKFKKEISEKDSKGGDKIPIITAIASILEIISSSVKLLTVNLAITLGVFGGIVGYYASGDEGMIYGIVFGLVTGSLLAR